jgi:hypothetical protein
MSKQMIIVAVAGLLVGLGGGTGFAVMTAPPADDAAAAEHAAADSAAVHDDAAATEHGTDTDPALADSIDNATEPPFDAATDDVSHDTAGNDPTGAGTAGGANPDPMAGATSDGTASDSTDSTAQLGRLLGGMKPDEAARILEPLTNEQVKKLLFALPERKASAILAKFKGDRAAALARAIIENAGTS